MQDLSGTRAVVTGGTRGLGLPAYASGVAFGIDRVNGITFL
jgi:NAD(P)-dependent dehydrogenase (short-subunit alcohol dehydrogenase family)